MAESKLPSEHIGNIPAGHAREEENRKRTDNLAEQAAADAESAGSIHSKALEQEEREILDNFNPFTLELEVSNKQPGRHYVWVLSNSTVIAAYSALGYRAVQGSDHEADEHKGQHKAAASTLRGVGDCLLYWIPQERYEQIERHIQMKTNALMAVEEEWANEANYGPNSATRRFGPLAH